MRKSLIYISLLASIAFPLGVAAGEDAGDTGGNKEAFSPATLQYDFAKGLLARNLFAEAAGEFSGFVKNFPKDPRVPEAVLWRAEALFAQDKYREASADFYTYLTAYKTDPMQAFARLRYGCCLFELGRHSQAVSTLEPLKGRNAPDEGTRITANYYLGLSYAALKQYPKALEALEKVTDGKLASDALYERAEVTAAKGDHAAATDLFAAFLGKYPDHYRAEAALLRQGEELRVAGRLDQAARSFESLIKRANQKQLSTARAKFGLAWVRYAQGNYTAARDLSMEVVASKEDVLSDSANYLLGLSAMRLGDNKAAEGAFSKVTKGNYAQNASVKRAWAFLASGDADSTLAAVEDTLKRFPKIPSSELEYVKGKALILKNDQPGAIRLFAKVREARAAYHAEAAYELANTFARTEKYKSAAESYAYFVKTFPQHPKATEALCLQGQALIKEGKYVEAITVYERALQDKQASKELRQDALGQQALCFFHIKQYANMSKSYALLLEEFPKSPVAAEAVYWLAWYEHHEKRFAKAARLYRKIMDEFPAHALASQARYHRAMSLYHDGQEDAAAEALYEIVTKHPHTQLDQKELLWLGQFLMGKKDFEKADKVYGTLLSPDSKAGREERALAFYYQAESRFRQKDWAGALKRYERLLAEKDTGLESAGNFGRAACLRRLGKLDEARKALDLVALRADDPLAAYYHAELGHLDYAEKKFDSAAAHLMRVGLLYDDEDLCGEALLIAGKACAESGDSRKALICFRELAGEQEGGFGRRYPKSEWTALGRAELEALLNPKPTPKADPVPAVKPEGNGS